MQGTARPGRLGTPHPHADTGQSFSYGWGSQPGSPWMPPGAPGTCKSGEAGWSGRKGGPGLGAPGGHKDLGLSSIQGLQGKVLPASSSFWGLQASVPGLVSASLPSLPPSPRGFSSVSVSLLLCVL